VDRSQFGFFSRRIRVAFRRVSMTALCLRGLAALRPLCWLAMALFLTASAVRADDTIVVHLDEARVIKLPDRAATVVVGNPLIADLTVQPGGLAVITGKSYGATNFLIMDKSGAVLTEHNVEVQGPTDKIVVVYRGINRATYSCTPECAARITLADQTEFFTDTLARTTARNAQSLAAGAGSSR
jgi:Flp pilus assembly secretin CpaC